MDKKTYKLKDFAEPIAVAVTDPQKSCHNIFVGLEHYDSGEPVISRFSDTSLLNSSCKEFQKNDILIARRNVYLRRAGIAPFDGLTSGDSIVLRLFEDCEERTGISYDVAIKVIPFVLNSNSFWLYANRHADGMNSKRISKEKVLDYEFSLPPLAEQKVLAEKLWAAYEVKQSYLKMIAATEEMIEASYKKMIETSDRKNCLGDYIVRMSAQKCGNRELPVLSITKDKGIVFQSERFESVVVSVDKSGYIIAPKGCLVQGIHIDECNFGIQKIVEEGIVSPAYKLWSFKGDDFIPELIEYYLRSPMAIKYFQMKFLGATVRRRQVISKDDFLSMPLNLPSFDGQKSYYDFFVKANKSISELRKSVDAIDKVIKSLINENL